MTKTFVIIGSSNIDKITYNDWYHDLVVTFRGNRPYIYRNVPQTVVTALEAVIQAGGSVGSFIYHNVRSNFEYQAV